MKVTNNQERYRSVIDTFHGLLQCRQDLQFESQWFQQDGATPYMETATVRLLDELVGGQVFFHVRHVLRTSVHLTSFCEDNCKDNVYHTNQQNVIEFQKSVDNFIANIPRGMGERVIENFRRRAG